jgi:hypothetical protein
MRDLTHEAIGSVGEVVECCKVKLHFQLSRDATDKRTARKVHSK